MFFRDIRNVGNAAQCVKFFQKVSSSQNYYLPPGTYLVNLSRRVIFTIINFCPLEDFWCENETFLRPFTRDISDDFSNSVFDAK